MKNSDFKYVSVSENEKKWGLYIKEAGHMVRTGNVNSDNSHHPESYRLRWRTGRILHGYQLIYIVRGKGIFENREREIEINEGDIIFLYPGIWHRYKPDPETGWESYFIGFAGPVINNLVSNGFFRKEQPVQHVGFDAGILALFFTIIEAIKMEQPGYQMIISGVLMKLLGALYSRMNQSSNGEKKYDERIQKARLIITNNLYDTLSMTEVAVQVNMSYSLFRREFKRLTGFAPGDFYLEMKIRKAKELLITTEKSIKEIGYELAFPTHEQFSKTFKKRTGETPGGFRNRNKF